MKKEEIRFIKGKRVERIEVPKDKESREWK
jgi:hypothetical protein